MATWLGPTYVEKRTDELWFVSILKGVTLLKQADGTWVQRVSPQDSEVRDAVKAYRGGYAYDLSAAEVAELTAAGFGGLIV